MTPARKRRLVLVLLLVLGVGSAAALTLTAFQQNMLYFVTPTEVATGQAPVERAFRTGGIVKQNSVKRQADGVTVHFDITDTQHTVTVSYRGILPDLFREGQGIVASGRFDPSQQTIIASEVLAKHDENYMPPEVHEALKRAGNVPKHDLVREP